ncbi:MAG TPA: hypothetical protein ENK32_12555, partial [Anaerolineae bacterium]|nr:hypothetical protein [Anaerolineae bacterium]
MILKRRSALFAWLFFGLVTAVSLWVYGGQLFRSAGSAQAGGPVWGLIPIVFAFVGALIISRQPRNVIGLLLMLPAFVFAIPIDVYLAGFAAAPENVTPLLL